MLHQVDVSFDLYYDARKHKIKFNEHVMRGHIPHVADTGVIRDAQNRLFGELRERIR